MNPSAPFDTSKYDYPVSNTAKTVTLADIYRSLEPDIILFS
jgi:hypothetical protein